MKATTEVSNAPGTAPGQVQFDASGSRSLDPNARIVSYEWAFGDGTTAAGATVAHTYAKPGSYTAIVVVTDSDGASALGSLVIAVSPVASSGPAVEAWSRHFEGRPALIASPTGDLFASTEEEAPNAAWLARVHRLGLAGEDQGSFVLGTNDSPGNLPSLIAASGDLLYAFADVSTQGGPMPRIDSWKPTGEPGSTVFGGTDVSHYAPFAVSASDDRAMQGGSFSQTSLDVHRADGSGISVELPSGVWLQQLAFAANGSVIATGSATHAWSLWGRDFTGAPFVIEVDRQGALVWSYELTGLAGQFIALGASATGTVVGVVQVQSPEATPETVNALLLALDSSGQPRWSRSLPTSSSAWQLAVDSTGEAALLAITANDCGGTGTVLRFDPSGKALGPTEVRTAGCGDPLWLGGIAYSQHHVVIAGDAASGTNVSSPGPFVAELAL